MGLSILIPVFNCDVRDLVNALAFQLNQTGITGEILLQDDGSALSYDEKNKTLAQISSVKYSGSDTNAGRTLTRKRLAEAAQYEYLLFLDSDSRIIKEDFLKIYHEQILLKEPLVSGGRIYGQEMPRQCHYRLHWKYGSRREHGKAGKGSAFQSNNFLVKKSLFLQLNFSEKLKGYGHEDSLWGIQLRQMGATIKKIENPVLHDKLEEAEGFLNKSTQALANLLQLSNLVDENILRKEIKIFWWYKRLKSLGLAGPFSMIERIFHSLFKANLLSCHPSLFIFDIYRLGTLTRMARVKNTGPD